MKAAKLTNEQLQRLVSDYSKPLRDEVVARPSNGGDCAALRFRDDLCVFTMNPITTARHDIGRLAVHAGCTSVAACGAEPIALGVSLLVPSLCEEKQVQTIMHQVQKTADYMHVEILGGRAEATDAVTRPVLTTTILAACMQDKLVNAANAKAGDDLLVTKTVGLEGAIILTHDFEEYVTHTLGQEDCAEILGLTDQLSAVAEGLTAARTGATAMLEVKEGGVLAAVYAFCRESRCGVQIEEKEIPVLEQTKKLCQALMIDPMRLASAGCLLITTPDGKTMIRELRKYGIPAAVIGKMRPYEDGMQVVCKDGQIRPLGKDCSDELQKVSRATLPPFEPITPNML